MGLALGNITRLRTRNLYAILHTRSAWSDRVFMDSKAREELVFWLGNVDCFNGQSIWRSPSAVRVVYSDASSTGFGSYIVEHGSHIVHGQWTL